ncbi:hypothetical protein I6F33_25540 [Bradyrhizobium sp. BRP20]|uniref:hypothetical protein n=1 Tax=unclassified Bradyrhizobium TaxID=2631580 RepID=UPI001CD395AC|nr:MULTISPECIES: hypothetical protein [unclassified Bradyrhizobium]MCA1436321.1 hypothetical protein [Bradyrhizobium sp. BRP20]MCA1471852.1 hypothetical protein [Bradyrhizobium sp. IC3195]MCA1551673.1 hypothetical protein [Bradyrhizobium sp. BRP19]
MLQPDRLSATKRAKLRLPSVWNTSLSLDFCDCRSDASLSMEDDRKPVETPSRSVVSLRRDWHPAAAFSAQVLEIVPKTKHGHVRIATPCKAVTEAHHVRSAGGQDFLGPPISRASVACAPRRCDRDHDRNEGRCTAMRIGNPAHSSLMTHQICLKPHIGNYYSFLNLFTGASAAMVALLRGSRNDYGLPNHRPATNNTLVAKTRRSNRDRLFSMCGDAGSQYGVLPSQGLQPDATVDSSTLSVVRHV